MTLYGVMATNKVSRPVICIGVCCVVIVGLLVAVIVLATKDNDSPDSDQAPTKSDSEATASLIDLFNVKDGIEVTWSQYVDMSVNDVHKAVEDKVDMIELWLYLWPGKSEFYMQDNTTTIDDIIRIIESSGIGLKIQINTGDPNGAVLKLLDKLTAVYQQAPILINMPLFSDDLFKWNAFLSEKKRYGENIFINVDLHRDEIGRGVIEQVDYLVKRLKQPSTVEISLSSLPSSWDDVRWLLDRNPHLSLVVTSDRDDQSGSSSKALIVRNDMDKTRVFYNFGKTIYNEFINTASTAGSPLLYFDINPPDAGQIIWSHNTDTWEQINAATKGDVMMIEGDIMVLGQGTVNQTDIPIMAHDIGDFNNITFEQWLDEIIKVNKGMKFDFKTIDAVKPALAITKQKLNQIKGPIWLNADVLRGPNAGPPRMSMIQFLDAISGFPATLSLGWTTVEKQGDTDLKYTMDMVREMYQTIENIDLPITFPVRAEQLRNSLEEFDWLLSQSRGYTVTVWTAPNDQVTKADMDFVKKQTEAARYYFDLPEELRPTF